MAKKPRNPENLGIRVRPFYSDHEMPPLANHLIKVLQADCTANGRPLAVIRTEKLPGSVNHMKPYRSHRLADWVHEFRASVKEGFDRSGALWNPKGTSSAVVLMYSPVWITKESRVRKFDADNRIKPIFDAIQHATGQPDQNHWSFHVFKVPARRERLVVYLFDLGDVVEYYY